MKVDIGQIINRKNPELYRLVPRFFLFAVEKIIHQDEINEVLEKFGNLRGVAFVSATLDFLGIKRSVDGLEKIPLNGRYLFVSNHPLGGLDGLVLAEAIYNRFGSVKVVVNDILMSLEPLSDIFVPINKHGKQSVVYVDGFNNLFKGDIPILYFPAGLCSRRVNGKITDLDWKMSFVNKAIDSDRDIVPMYVENVNSNRFYNIAYWRKTLGIKANIEMMLLPDELFKLKGKGFIKAKCYNTINHETLVNLYDTREWCSKIRKICYNESENRI